MDRLISEQAVIDRLTRWYSDMLETSKEQENLIEVIKAIPSAEPKTGYWIWQTEDIYRCSECGEDIHVKEVMNVPQYKWCPMCGSRLYTKV